MHGTAAFKHLPNPVTKLMDNYTTNQHSSNYQICNIILESARKYLQIRLNKINEVPKLKINS